MVVAKIEVFDDETGQVFAKDKLIQPVKENLDFDVPSTSYLFAFKIRVLNFDKQIIEPDVGLLEKIGCPNPDYTVPSEEIHRHLSKKEENNGVHEA